MSINEELVCAFIDARSQRPLWPEMPHQARPKTIADGYRLQRAIHRRLDGSDTRVGYKIGSTSAAGQRAFGLREPVYAGLFLSGRAASLANALSRPLAKPSLECEIAVILGTDIDGSDPTLSSAKITDSIRACHIGCEIIDNRYGDPLAVGVPDLIADDFFHASFVVGAANPGWRAQDLGRVEAAVDVEGHRFAGTAQDVMSAPAAVLWLARKLAVIGTTLRAGEIIMTGSITAPVPVTLPVRAMAMSITGFPPLAL